MDPAKKRRGPYSKDLTGNSEPVEQTYSVKNVSVARGSSAETSEDGIHVVWCADISKQDAGSRDKTCDQNSEPEADDLMQVTYTTDTPCTPSVKPTYSQMKGQEESITNPPFNDAFDEQFDEVIESIQEESRKRDYDLLAEETENENFTLFKETEILEHFTSVIHDSTEIHQKNKGMNSEKEDVGTAPLFENSPHSLGATVLLICCFIIRFRLPDEALSYLLQMFACLLPHGHKLMGSLYHFRNFMQNFTSDILPVVYYHCNFCYTKVDRLSKSCPSCHKTLTQSGSMAYFLQLKLVSQLQSLWKNSVFSDSVRTHRFKHFSGNANGSIQDIYDGKLYKNLFDNDGILSCENNLSFSLNTDGAPLFKSSNVGIWPVYMLINELPPAQRKRRQFSLFYGVWVSSRKPQMWSFLKPLYEELRILETTGHIFEDASGCKFTSKCVLLTCTCDLPARAIVYNCNQFNGQYSCWFCLDRGETYRLDSGGICHIFPYRKENPKGTLRTTESVRRDVQESIDNFSNDVRNFSVHGHKGPFWFMYLEYFDVVHSCVIDYMHGICLGIVKQLLTLWFDKKNKNEKFSFFKLGNKVNDFLKGIKPTLFVTRIPRSLEDLSNWKSSEFRNFLLYWGVPILRNVLDNDYFVHFCLLARAFYLLSKESVSDTDLENAEGALLLFVEYYDKLYGQRYCTLNLHQLVHLTDCVRYTGPLYVNNCFIFEDLNGYIIKHIHGTQGIDTQLTNIISLLKVTPIMFDKYLKDGKDDEILEICNELNDSVSGRHKYLDEIEDGIRPVGSATWKVLTEEEAKLAKYFGILNKTVKCFSKINMYKRGFYVYSKEYTRLQKRQQNVVTFISNQKMNFGSVLCFVQSDEQHPTRTINMAIIIPYTKVQSVGCVWEVRETENIDMIPMQCILNVNNIVTVNGKLYVCPSPNRYDRD